MNISKPIYSYTYITVYLYIFICITKSCYKTKMSKSIRSGRI